MKALRDMRIVTVVASQLPESAHRDPEVKADMVGHHVGGLTDERYEQLWSARWS